MSKLFAGKGRINYLDGRGNQFRKDSPEFDWRVKVVCAACNNSWMSDIESQHAEPVLTPLIEGRSVSVNSAVARSVAIFTFKTAAVIDYAHSAPEGPFFSNRIRYAFRQQLAIPSNTQMWMGGFEKHRKKIKLHTVQHHGKLTPSQPVSMFVFTCALGFLVLQLVHVKVIGTASFTPAPGFDTSMAPFWPEPYPGLMWPLPVNLMNDQQFTALEGRWQTIGIID